MFIDTAVSALVFKSGLQDYLNYEFYNKSFSERKTYATIGYQNKFYELAANVKYAPFSQIRLIFIRILVSLLKESLYLMMTGFLKLKILLVAIKSLFVNQLVG